MENSKLLRHFGLVREPFHVAPRRRDFYPAAAAPPGMAALVDGEGGRARLITVTGEPGTGRTSALRRLAGELRSEGWRVFAFEAATAPHPERLSHDDILRAACRSFGLYEGFQGDEAEEATEATDAAVVALRAHAFDEQGRSPLAIVADDTGRLADDTLAGMLRLIAPPDRGPDGLVANRGPTAIGLVLGGTPALLDRLAELAPDLVRHMDGAANIADVRLRPLASEDVAAYVEHCLAAAGSQGRALFDAGAIECLAQKSGGNLGEINALGAPAMIFAWQASRQSITADLIDGTGIRKQLDGLEPALPVAAEDGSPTVPLATSPAAIAAQPRTAKRRHVWLTLGCAALLAALFAGAVGGPFMVDGAQKMLASLPDASARPNAANGSAATPTAGLRASLSAAVSGVDQVSVRAEPAPPVATDAARPGEANPDALVERGQALLRGADAVSARRFFSRAAESGSAAAAAAMAASYDPLYLAENAIRGVEADPEQAASWYRIAIARGDGDAQARLSALLGSPSHL